MGAENSTGTGMRPPTLNIFPSQPMHVEPSSTKVSIKILLLLYIMVNCLISS